MMKKNNMIQAIGMVLLSLCLLLLFSSTALASGTDTVRVTFTNERSDSPDLYVAKQVESADSRYPAPEGVRFTFTLKLGGSPAKDVVYRVFNENGDEVYLYENGEESTESKANKLYFATDRGGNFTLKAGQTAKFEKVGAGTAYEVAELPEEGYTQTAPAGGVPAVGTVPAEGKRVNFTNRYIPDGGIQKTTSFQVSKAVIYPEGYSYPGAQTFGFTLHIAGAACGKQPYTIREDATGETVGTGTTDSSGHFTLCGGQTAVFENVPVNVDYKVEEDALTGGWRAVGQTSFAGATKAPVTVASFTNAIASFGVTKTVEGEAKEGETFRFLLTDQDGKALAGADYYLFASDASLAEEELQQTDASGYFILKDGQTAIFQGIEPGTVYTVREDAKEGYTQTLPVNPGGYTGKTVGDAVEILPFVNTVSDEKGILTVTKTVESIAAGDGSAEETFTFRLASQKLVLGMFSLTDNYEPVKDAVYSVRTADGEKTFKTAEDGTFTLHANETARFEGLPLGYQYQAEEIDIPEDYQLESEDRKVQEGKLKNPLHFIFNNCYMPPCELTVKKELSGDDTETERAFAFRLTVTEPDGTQQEPENFSLKGGESQTFQLRAGVTYEITETEQTSLEKSGYTVTVPENASGRLNGDTEVVFVNARSKSDIPKTPGTSNPSGDSGQGSHGSGGSSTTGSSTTGTTSAKTGDRAPVLLWLFLLLAAGAGILVIVWMKRNNRNEEPKDKKG